VVFFSCTSELILFVVRYLTLRNLEVPVQVGIRHGAHYLFAASRETLLFLFRHRVRILCPLASLANVRSTVRVVVPFT
jgi:hypothetical protein